MIDDLTLEQRKQLEIAILSAFDLADFTRMLNLELGIKLGQEVSINQGFRNISTDLLDVAIRGGWLEKLLLGAHRFRAGNQLLNKVVQTLGVVTPQTIPKDAPMPVAFNGILASGSLQKILDERTSFLKINDFIQRLQHIGSRICRIECPEGTAQGTGWLVGSDLLLTAYHVVIGVHEQSNGFTAQDIVCRFDYTDHASDHASDTNALGGRICRLADAWLIDYSPYAQADILPLGTEPTDQELDYALIQLSEPIGNGVVAQDRKRGWIQIPENPTVMVQSNDVMFIPQHPQGRTLELAFGAVLTYNTNATRLRYNANTDEGSSGSPCFDSSLTPFGLHHASGPAKSLRYNQCIPLRQLIRRMKQNPHVPAFWIND